MVRENDMTGGMGRAEVGMQPWNVKYTFGVLDRLNYKVIKFEDVLQRTPPDTKYLLWHVHWPVEDQPEHLQGVYETVNIKTAGIIYTDFLRNEAGIELGPYDRPLIVRNPSINGPARREVLIGRIKPLEKMLMFPNVDVSIYLSEFKGCITLNATRVEGTDYVVFVPGGPLDFQYRLWSVLYNNRGIYEDDGTENILDQMTLSEDGIRLLTDMLRAIK